MAFSALNHWTPMGLRGRREGTSEYLYLTDAMGSVRMGLNAQGQVVQAMDYTPYGHPLRLLGGASGHARAGYTEKEWDEETGLTYFGARYLDAEVGSWTAVDPMGQYHHSYSFVGGNPIAFIDPWGLEGVSPAPYYFPGNDLYIPSYPDQAAGMPTSNNVQINSFGPEPRPVFNVCCSELPDISRSRPVPMNFTTENHPGVTEEKGPITEEEVDLLARKLLEAAGVSASAMSGGAGNAGRAMRGARSLGQRIAGKVAAGGGTDGAAAATSTAAGSAGKVAKNSSQVLEISSKQLQAKFKHAHQFGVSGNYSKATASKFSAAINQHINASTTKAIQGTYHSQPVTHYLNPQTGLNVIADPSGKFISGWQLNATQLNNVLTHGGL